MIEALTVVALVPALLATPILLAAPRGGRRLSIERCAWAAAAAVILNVAVPLALHGLAIPIAPVPLAAAHALVLAVALGAWLVRRRRKAAPAEEEHERTPAAAAPLVWMAAAFTALVVPVTHLAGMDTYRWQDLATNVLVEGRIPWLVHPASLLGFTPRSYPSAQPLVLASIQILGHTGVDLGFYLLSVLLGITGLLGARVLGERLTGSARTGNWLAFLYVFSPVFMRYNHWATGRGLLLAVLPLFLATGLRRPSLASAAGAVLLGLMLPLAHKAGAVALAVLLPAFALSALLPRWRAPAWRVVLLLAALAAGWALAPGSAGLLSPGRALSFAGQIASRLALIAPLAAVGLLGTSDWVTRPAWRCMLVAGLVTFPGLCYREMYGALMALPFAAFAAAVGLERAAAALAPGRRRALHLVLLAAGFAIAAAVVAERSRHATPAPVYRAARFLDRFDPAGPYEIVAPGRVRVQMQAYVRGCPRFPPPREADTRVRFTPPPPLRADRRAWLQDLVQYLRNLLELEGSEREWYAQPPRAYIVTVAGEGTVPRDAPLLYEAEGVRIYGPVEQHGALPGSWQPRSGTRSPPDAGSTRVPP